MSVIPKVCLNTRTANATVAVILFFAFSWGISIIFNRLFYSFFSLYFICWYCVPSLSSVPKYLHVIPCLSSCISLLKWNIKFCEWTNFPLRSTNIFTLVKSKFLMDIITDCSVCLHLCLQLFLCFIYQLQIILVKQMWYFSFAVCSWYPDFNLFKCSVRAKMLMQRSSGGVASPWNILRFISTSSVSIIFPSVCRRILVIQ